MIKEFKLPEISENVKYGEVVKILVSVGDFIELDQPVIEMETEKAIFEVPSNVKGKITEINLKVGEKIEVGQVILKVDIEDEKKDNVKMGEVKEKQIEEENQIFKENVEKFNESENKVLTEGLKISKKQEIEEEPKIHKEIAPAAPSVRHFAWEIGVDINKVTGTGPGGRISMEDVKNYAKKIVTAKREVTETMVLKPLPDFSKWGEVERKPMSGVRKVTAENMSYAWSTVPMVTQYDKSDITELEKYRKNYQKKLEEIGGKVTITSILIKVTASALKVFQQFNASLDIEKREIIYKKYYNIGVAVDTERGLLVPVIRNVDKKNILELSIELTELAEKVRNKKITAKELEGGNITISNLGGIGGTNFSPIVYSPQVAIIGVSHASMESIYIGEKFEPRLMLPLSLSYDHRVIDGADGARFLRWVAEALEQPLMLCFEG